MAKREKWGSKIGFILAASGSAIGLGNIWRFPYTVGQNGGALFVILYLIAIVGIGLPVLIAEISLGRFTGKNPVGAYNFVKPNSKWNLVGYLGVGTGVMILSFYSVVAGWTVGYFYKAVTGKLNNITSESAKTINSNFSSDSLLQIILLSVFILLTIAIVSRGISSGIEMFSKILMPLLLVILVILLVRSLTLENASAGLKYYLNPDFSKFNFKIVVEALGQAFFSLSLGMGSMITYGSYLKRKENLVSSAVWIAAFDTGIALMAGLIIFPAIFSQHMDPAGGPGLVFQVLPVIFAKMPGGHIFGSLFFALLTIAALTSSISMLEVPVSYAIDEKKIGRKKAAFIIGGIAFLFAIPSALSEKFLTTMNYIWGNLSLSFGALFIAIFVAYIWKAKNALKEMSTDDTVKKMFLWSTAIKYTVPISILIILIGIIFFGITF
jgi:NSS family neurotransmitter:Na+ symporter